MKEKFNMNKQSENKEMIEELLSNYEDELAEWELNFLNNTKNFKILSVIQEQKLEEIYEKIVVGENDADWNRFQK